MSILIFDVLVVLYCLLCYALLLFLGLFLHCICFFSILDRSFVSVYFFYFFNSCHLLMYLSKEATDSQGLHRQVFFFIVMVGHYALSWPVRFFISEPIRLSLHCLS